MEKVFRLSSEFRIKIAQQARGAVFHIASQAKDLSYNLETLLKGAEDPADPYDEDENQRKSWATNLVREIRTKARSFVRDMNMYGVSEAVSSDYKSNLQMLLSKLKMVIVNGRYHALLRPLEVALNAFNPTAISKIEENTKPPKQHGW